MAQRVVARLCAKLGHQLLVPKGSECHAFQWAFIVWPDTSRTLFDAILNSSATWPGHSMMQNLSTVCAVWVALASSLGIASPLSAQDWAGGYGALSVSQSDGELTENAYGNPVLTSGLAGRQVGLNLGYSFVRGKLVYGAELSFNPQEIELSAIHPTKNYLDRVIDLKARAGYVSGDYLWYGVLALTRGDGHIFGIADSLEPLSVTGFSYGVGVDRHLTEQVFVGAEVLHRNLETGGLPGAPESDVEYSFTSLAVRLGMKF